MNKILKIKLISYSILLCVFLNISLHSLTLNANLNLSIAFSCVADTITYSYNPIQFTKELKDNLLSCLYKSSDKQSKKKDEQNAAGNKRNDFITTPFSYWQIKTLKQFDNITFGKYFINDRDRLSANNLSGKITRNAALFAFYFMLFAWLAIIFRKRRNLLKNRNFTEKTYNSAF